MAVVVVVVVSFGFFAIVVILLPRVVVVARRRYHVHQAFPRRTVAIGDEPFRRLVLSQLLLVTVSGRADDAAPGTGDAILRRCGEPCSLLLLLLLLLLPLLLM